MVAVTGLEHLPDREIYGSDPGCAVVEGLRDLSVKAPEIRRALVPSSRNVDASNKLSPAHDLSNESFQGVDRDSIVVGTVDSCVDDLLWCQQAHIKHGSKYTVVQN